MSRSRTRARGRGAVGPRGPLYDAESSDYFARSGMTTPAAMSAVDAFIAGTKSDLGVPFLADVFDQIQMQANESAAAVVADFTANAMNHTLVNSPTVTQWRGVTGSQTGAQRYIDMGFNPTVNAARYTQNSHAFGFYCRTPGTAQDSIGAMNGSFQGRTIYVDAGGVFVFRDTSADMAPSNAGGKSGLLSVSRTASNASAGYKDGTSLATATNTPIAEINLGWVLCAINNIGTVTARVVESSFSFISRGLTAGEMAAFSARVQTLKTAIGW